MVEDKKDMVFLYDPLLPMWDVPNELGYYSLNLNGSQTSLLSCTGFFNVAKKFETHILYANACKYEALVKRVKVGNSETDYTKLSLFHGGIQIFKNGIIEGTDIEGIYLLKREKIWITSNGFSDELKMNADLNHLIFENNENETRVEAILKGIEFREEQMAKNIGLYDIYNLG